jgi:hypothetical protein
MTLGMKLNLIINVEADFFCYQEVLTEIEKSNSPINTFFFKKVDDWLP